MQTYIQKDLRQLIDVNDEITFINFIKLLASNIGQELVYDNYAKELRVSAVTIKR
ncbi:MAG: hypothetical protein MJ201_05545 [Mycoplasmoidaceae bacterium]|nr:hypothetical protein [Mycoplasmoidaceae bacterium]